MMKSATLFHPPCDSFRCEPSPVRGVGGKDWNRRYLTVGARIGEGAVSTCLSRSGCWRPMTAKEHDLPLSPIASNDRLGSDKGATLERLASSPHPLPASTTPAKWRQSRMGMRTPMGSANIARSVRRLTVLLARQTGC